LKDWPLQVSIVDTIWGTVLTGLSSYIGYYISKLFVNFS
jgi:uncharacterized membrane protein